MFEVPSTHKVEITLQDMGDPVASTDIPILLSFLRDMLITSPAELSPVSNEKDAQMIKNLYHRTNLLQEAIAECHMWIMFLVFLIGVFMTVVLCKRTRQPRQIAMIETFPPQLVIEEPFKSPSPEK